jgi:hypothetical protein
MRFLNDLLMETERGEAVLAILERLTGPALDWPNGTDKRPSLIRVASWKWYEEKAAAAVFLTGLLLMIWAVIR